HGARNHRSTFTDSLRRQELGRSRVAVCNRCGRYVYPQLWPGLLRAALAYWQYAEQSAHWVFGDAIGDPTADTILNALRRSGELDREDIVNLLGRHVNRPRIDAALGLLLSAGLARPRRDSSTGGRPREVWRVV
ncbi:MAG: hypothetical protein M3O34_17750, partial [Chloroflexota bacterium]|nr:hypothetical protein [Chloroflexota bacterium]